MESSQQQVKPFIAFIGRLLKIAVQQSEIEHRDHVLRAYFGGRDWDKNSEYALKRKLVLSSAQLLPAYPYVIEDEWEVEAGRADRGRGDLVFTDGGGRFAVVEVKWIDLYNIERTGSTRRVSNRKKRRTVEEQAVKYATHYARVIGGNLGSRRFVEAFIFTNEEDCPCFLQAIEL